MRRVAAAAIVLPLAWTAACRAQSGATPRERIEITGSRIVSSDVESASPIAIISAEEIRASGYASLELILNNYPQLVADQGSRVSNGATGTSAANLRGLLPERTLILVNGRRLLSGSPFLLAGDLNQMPVHLVSRIEILTGGASAVHGSDAIAGVVNIILKDRFEGVEGSVVHDFYNHRQKNAYVSALVRESGYDLPGDKPHDGATTSATLTLGGNFAHDRGNATASFRYLESAALLQSERDYSACAVAVFDYGTPDEFRGCGGAATGFPGRFIDLTTRRQWTVADAAGNVRQWVGTSDSFNFAPWNYYQRPIERYGFNGFIHYDLSPSARVYGEIGVHDDRTVAQIAPSGLFGGVTTVRWENPLLTDAWRSRFTFRNEGGEVATGPGTTADIVIQRRNVEGGGRRFEFDHTSYREVLGLKGALRGPWEYDAYFQTAKVIASQISTNDFSITRLNRALDVVADPATGVPRCAVAVSGMDPACVPWNIWRLGGVTPEALEYLQVPAFQRGFTAQSLLSASVRGELGDYGLRLPWSRDAIEVAFGAERRTDKMDLASDTAFSSGDLAGAGESSPPISGRVTVKEVFGEVRVPVVDRLSVSASYRYSDYSTGVGADTFGIGFNAAPIEALRLRGSAQRAVRAANISELFTPQVQSGWGLFPDDPCAGETPRASLAQCARTGVSAAQYGRIPPTPGGVDFPAIRGGNPALEPETAKTLTLGLAFAPTRDFSATLDYFTFRIDDFITEGAADVIFQHCLDTGDPLLCGLIRRDPALGTLWVAPARVTATFQNAGRVKLSGADLAVNYRIGAFALAAIGTYLRSFMIENFRGADAVECAGRFFGQCSDARPKWRHKARLTWDGPWNLQLSASWRYLHGMKDPDRFAPDLPRVSYLDTGLAWSPRKDLTIRIAVDNVTDRDPPIIVSAAGLVNGNTFVQTYDALGRHVSVALQARF